MSRPIETFLRSINLRMDVGHAERFAHFRPTGKSAQVTDAITRGVPSAASIVVAAYGSGKSIAAGTGALLVENTAEAKPVTQTLAARFRQCEPTVAQFAEERLDTGARGAAIVLEGAQDDPVAALRAAAEERLGDLSIARSPSGSDPLPVLRAIVAAAQAQGLDRIALIWDEFGRHLEALASSGRPEELSLVQQIAEWSARQDSPVATFTVLMHQNFFHYASALSQTARNAWRKIEGRFASIRFVDDSKEMHQLTAWVVAQSRPAGMKPPKKAVFNAAAAEAKQLGYFAEFDDKSELAATLQRAYPLAPAALHLLPRLAARMAQNERTVFSFLDTCNLYQPVTLYDLFAGFSEAMRSDTGAGGAHRRWLEAQTALSKTESDAEADAIAAAALLGLGAAGQRMRLSMDGLLFALDAYGTRSREDIRAAVNALTERKLLLYRERTDDITVWHGTDLDLRGRLEEEKLRQDAEFDLVSYLNENHPPEAWKPVKHNLTHDIRRYFQGAYVSAAELIKDRSQHPLLQPLAPGEDGRIVYALPEGPQQIGDLERIAEAEMPADRKTGIVLVFPGASLPIAEVALEAACLDALQQDPELIGKDPFALPEIQHMADAAHQNLRRQLARFIYPTRSASWYVAREKLDLSSDKDLRHELSEIANKRFDNTPQINNEVVVRKNLSRPMVNARKKVILGVLERSDQPHLGFDAGAKTPFASIYRTVLNRTGLHCKRRGGWRFAEPSEITDVGLKEVWGALERFFADPGEDKSPALLIADLQSPPYGVRYGVIPLLVASALKAFGQAVVIRHEGAYIPDVLASHIEDFCANPDSYTVEVVEINDARRRGLQALTDIFGAEHAGGETDQLRRAWDAIQAWKQQLPKSALRSRSVGSSARSLQLALRYSEDPVDLFLHQMPKIADSNDLDERAVDAVDAARRELEGIVVGYQSTAIEAIRETITISSDTTDAEDALQRAQNWASCIADHEALQRSLDGSQRALLQQARTAASGRHTEASFARALSNILIGKDFDQWEDRTPRYFASMLRATVHQIETAALNASTPDRNLQPLIETRINHLLHQMQQIAPPEDVERLLSQLRKQ